MAPYLAVKRKIVQDLASAGTSSQILIKFQPINLIAGFSTVIQVRSESSSSSVLKQIILLPLQLIQTVSALPIRIFTEVLRFIRELLVSFVQGNRQIYENYG